MSAEQQETAETRGGHSSAEERCRALLASIEDGFCVLRMIFDEEDRPIDYVFVDANAAFEEHTGLRNALGRTAREMVPDLDESWFRLYGAVAKTGENLRFENHAPAMGGRWFEVSASRVGRPELREVALVFRNITSRKVTDARLQESEARFRNMADHAPVMLWVTDAAGACTYLNRRWYEFTGEPAGTGLGLGWTTRIHDEDRQRVTDAFLAANASRAAFQVEYRLRRADGAHRRMVDTASPRLDAGGEFLGYIGSLIDVTDERLASEERERLLTSERLARAQAEEANRLKDEFLSTVSHELRTPLSAILGWTQMARTGTLPEEKRRRALEVIERNARSQAQLIEDLLDVGRIINGKLTLSFEPVDPSAVVRAAVETVRPAAEAKGIHLEVALAPPVIVRADASRLQQVAWNLLSNAVKFTPAAGRVEVRVVAGETDVVITVTDSGQGIAGAFLPHVFERFRQANATTTREHGGLGIGLSIVKHLVEAQGGTVIASSEGEGRGATFTVTLPVAPPVQESAPDVAPPDVDTGEAAPDLDGLRIVVVDDEDDTREVLRALLESCGARVTAARDARDGLRLLEAQEIDVLISDIAMPEQDGYSFIRQVRARPSAANLPAIALTAFARAEDRRRALLAGFDTHVSKPVEPLELVAVIAALVSRPRAER